MAKATPSSRITVLMFTDIVGSVVLKTRLGNAEAVELIQQHDRLFKAVIERSPGATILKDTGDGFLANFDATSEAVLAALRFQHAIATKMREGNKQLIRVRIGIHLGEVSHLDRETQTGVAKVSGLAVDFAARVMGLALPGQILLTRAAFDNARMYVRDHPKVDDKDDRVLKWMAHGPYVFQGSEDPTEVFEVGAVGIGPLVAPPDSEKAHRAVEPDDEEIFGWRPASALPVPGRADWVLDRRIGEGGFGEVWLARNENTGATRVFKFCFDAERLRSFKRELTLFRLLREELGDRHDIARLYEVRLDEPPFYLETEYTKDGSLEAWAKAEGGIDKVPLADRLELVARISDAVAAAHSVGVLHKDIKPANILIYRNEDGRALPQLSDFGIGMLTERGKTLTQKDLTESFVASLDDDSLVMTGTPMYTPPDALAGKGYSIHGDLYALGVLLYQMVIGDLDQPLGQGWERDVDDALLRRDINVCVEAHEDQRINSARELAERLRTLEERRRAELRKQLAKLGSIAAVLLVVLVGLLTGLFIYERGLRHEAEIARAEAEIAQARAEANKEFFIKNFIKRSDPTKQGRGFAATGPNRTIADSLIEAREQADVEFADDPEIHAEVLLTIAESFKNLRMIAQAEEAARAALDICLKELAENHPLTAQSQFELANALWFLGLFERDRVRMNERYEEALQLAEHSLRTRRDLFGAESVEAAESVNTVAACQNSLGNRTEAEQNYRRVIEIREALYKADPEGFDGMLIPAAMNNLAMCLRDQGRPLGASRVYEGIISAARELGGENHIYVAKGLTNLATLLDRIDQPDRAEEKLRESVAVYRNAVGPNNRMVAQTEHHLSQMLWLHGKSGEAVEAAKRALEIRRIALEPDDPEITDSLILLGEQLTYLIECDDAKVALDEAHERAGLENRPAWYMAVIDGLLATCIARAGDFTEAEPKLVQGLATIRAAFADSDMRVQNAVRRLITLYELMDTPGKVAEYQAMLH